MRPRFINRAHRYRERAHCLIVTSPEAFFALVDRHVTGPMTDADYVKIGDYDHLSRRARTLTLVTAHSRWRLPSLFTREPKERALEVGFEGPGEADERWVRYVPEAENLDLRDWDEELDGHADWDVWNDSAVRTVDELERRLRVVGAAMRGRAGD